MLDRYLTKRNAMRLSLKTKRLDRCLGCLDVRFQVEVFGTGQLKDLTRRAVSELEELVHELRELVSELGKLVRELLELVREVEKLVHELRELMNKLGDLVHGLGVLALASG
ncbi:MAG TPA: hypothetical protein VN380_03270 [Thermoanaerobaculia bacterium]|jgi:hypothetical protein|nr:hypothetical protein [Thermoanaerobaculia bacterium]